MTQPEKPKQASSHGNTGHGHVFPRPDGVLARCGGPGICYTCSTELAMKTWAAYPTSLREALEALHTELACLGVEGDVRVLLPNPGHLGISRFCILQQYGPSGRITLELEESAKEPYVPSPTRGDL